MPHLRDKKFTKQAFGPAAALIPLGMHIGQNAALDRILRTDSVGKLVAGRMRDGFTGGVRGSSVSTLGEAASGAADAILPEIGLLGDGASSLGKRFADSLRAQGIDPNNMARRQYAAMHRALEGDFEKALRLVKNDPVGRRMLGTGLDSVLPQHLIPKDAKTLGKLVGGTDNPAFARVKDQLSKDLTDAYSRNPLTNDLGRNVSRHLRNPRPTLHKAVGGTVARKGLDVAANVGMSVVDPLSAGVNLGKRGLMSSRLGKIPAVAKIQSRLKEIFTTNPIKNMYTMGTQGRDPKFPTARRLLSTYVKNPVTGHAEALAHSAGKLVNKYQPVLDTAQNIARAPGVQRMTQAASAPSARLPSLIKRFKAIR